MTALYVHVPFCVKKCNYCDFVSYAGKEELIDKYVEALGNELQSLLTAYHLQLTTLFFGGGTPTLLEPKHFDKIINTLIGHWKFDIGHSELSIEANPGTADQKKLRALRQLGINRLSIGAQSFNERHLKTLGRIHDAKTIFQFYDDAQATGFANINLDLIFALPGQTLADWLADLQTAIKLQPEHISTYNLQIEDGTAFSLWEKGGALRSADEGIALSMYEYAIETLTAAGYKHYEISNFAKPGRECQHNLTYWWNENYLGIGAGAHSHVNGNRWANPNCVEKYITPSSFLPLFKGENVESAAGKETSGGETLWLGLRLLDGLPAEKFYGFEKEVAELTKNGLLETFNGNIKLTRRGLYLGNEVFERFV
ncbi:radical SAM family heme chaperone HemW [Candidatus Saganbacteria bacterium]|nr:radical SAM family heme chaperone HemW [Candidatus Saganbacteria bacterium]